MMALSIPPALVLAGLLSTAYGAAFHLVAGGGLRRLLLYIVAGWVGFALGQFAGVYGDTDPLRIGQVHVVSATLGSWLALILAHWLIPAKREER
ncbi:MAG: hypothetical protein C4309_13125 [Chloroflexota bacterium]